MNRALLNILLFELSDKKFAFLAKDVVRVVDLVEITAIPEAPDSILGVINVHGEIVAIGDLKRKLKIKPGKFFLDNKIVLLNYNYGKIGVVVDKLIGYRELEEGQVVEGSEILPDLKNVKGVVKLNGDIILVSDLDKFLNINEAAELKNVLEVKR